jgi:hypothetical protein
MPTPTVNPYAIIASLWDQYNYAIAVGVVDPAWYQQLQSQVNQYVTEWEKELNTPPLPGGGPDVMEEQRRRKPILQNLVDQGRDLSGRIDYAAKVSGGVQIERAKQAYVSSQSGADRQKMIDELADQVARGVPLEDAVRVLAASGQYDVTDLQYAAFHVGDPELDPAAALAAPAGSETQLPFAPGGGSKPFEEVPWDLTTPQEEFDKAFAQFTRQLETSQTGRAPQIGALTERRFDLYNKYLGEIEARKARGEEPENVFKEQFVNIGKSTDPQFDQTTDRFQRTTVRPSLSAFDFLLKNVDPEDVLASTPFEQRPGRSTGGFRGYIRRTNV